METPIWEWVILLDSLNAFEAEDILRGIEIAQLGSGNVKKDHFSRRVKELQRTIKGNSIENYKPATRENLAAMGINF